MCGIVGIFSYADRLKTWPKDGLDFMLNQITHRGPDDKGMHIEDGLFLGHTRLAVIDLSPTGHQPMMTGDKKYIVSYNGEIYNFRQIRNELEHKNYKFRSQSDTEVLLYAWQEWREACLEKIDGIFAFAIYDRNAKELFLVRDHLGVKPLFYTMHHGQIVFASELMALFGPLNPCPDVEGKDLDTYFTFNYLPSPRTGLKGVSQLSPGCILSVNRHGESLKHYWKPIYKTDIAQRACEQTERFKELLSSSVKTQLVSDAPLGLFLSGGLDSYSVALSSVETGHHPETFTLGFDDKNFSEVAAAEQYSEYLGITNESTMFVWNENEIYSTLGAMSELLADASCFPLYQLSRCARKRVTVALAGDGGDELLAGYDTYKAGEITPFIRMLPDVFKRSLRGIARWFPSDNRRYGLRMVVDRLLDAADEGYGRDHASFRRIFSPAIKKRLYTPDFYKATAQLDPLGEYASLLKEVPADRSYLTARQHADLIFHLPSILAKVDRMSMANSLEVRVPLLSRQMIEFCINLPDNAKRSRGKGKHILREAISGKIPRGSLSRPKAGFLPPVDKWFRVAGPMNRVFDDHLYRAKSSIDWLNWKEVEKIWEEHRKGKIEAGFILLGILQFINWSQQCKIRA